MDSRSDTPTVTRQQLGDALGRLGVVPGDVLFVHSSLKSLGYMDGGPDGAVDGLLAAVGPAGHVAVPTHTACYGSDPAITTPYDKATTASRTGAITEALRLRPGAHRSDHSTHSVAAIGPAAELLVSGHSPAGGTCSINGPHGRYVRWGGRILFIGVGLSANTTYHAVEEWLDLPYMPDAPTLVARRDGPPQVVIVNRPSGHRNFYRNVDRPVPNTVTDELDRRGLIRKVMLNQAPLLLVHSRDVVRVTTECELAAPGALLCPGDHCPFCELARHLCVKDRDRIIARAKELLARPQMCDPSAPADRRL